MQCVESFSAEAMNSHVGSLQNFQHTEISVPSSVATERVQLHELSDWSELFKLSGLSGPFHCMT